VADPSADEYEKPTSSEPSVFVCDETSEGARVSAVLRARGYSVVELPTTRLVERVRGRHPALIIGDADADDGMAVLRELLLGQGLAHIHLVALAGRGWALGERSNELDRVGVTVFERPVDTYALVRRVEDLLGPPRQMPGTSVEPPEQWSVPPDSGGVPPSIGPSTRPGPWIRAPFSASSSSLDQWPQENPTPNLPLPQTEISPELQEVLRRAEQRLASISGSPEAQPARMSPEEELEAFIPSDVLAALDEPLDAEDIDAQSASQVSEQSPSGLGTGSEHGSVPGTGPETGTGSQTPIHAKSSNSALGPDEGACAAPRDDPPEPASRTNGLGPGEGTPEEDRADSDSHFSAVPAHPSTFPPAFAPTPSDPDPAGALPTARPGAQSLAPTGKHTSDRQATPGPVSYDAGDYGPHTVRVGPIEPTSAPEGLTPTPDTPLTTRPPRRATQQAPDPSERAPLGPPLPEKPQLPATLGPGDALRALAQLVRARYTGAVAFEDPAGIHRIVLREGDFVTAASGVEQESLVAFLRQRGALGADAAEHLERRIPQFGRHAGAALIANGHLRQDELWPVLRAHAEWLIGHTLLITRGAVSLESEIPARLKAEPAVFGGTTGAEVLVEVVRRVVAPEQAIERLGSKKVQLVTGTHGALLAECGLREHELRLVEGSPGSSLAALLQQEPAPDFAAVVYALVELGVLDRVVPELRPTPLPPRRPRFDDLDEVAQRTRILARKALVEEGDYFAILGVSRTATSYDIRRAYLELKRELEPVRALTSKSADLSEDLDVILEVLDEAYEILSDPARRDRYRRALEAAPR
jgi:hypothetical protein